VPKSSILSFTPKARSLRHCLAGRGNVAHGQTLGELDSYALGINRTLFKCIFDVPIKPACEKCFELMLMLTYNGGSTG